jgi:hypothetical protein
MRSTLGLVELEKVAWDGSVGSAGVPGRNPVGR